MRLLGVYFVFNRRYDNDALLHFRGSKVLPFRVDPFSEGGKNQFNRFAPPERVSIPIKVCLESS